MEAGKSLWLVPSPRVSQMLKKIIHIHPRESISPLSYPPFEPHITLGSAANFDLLRSAIRDLNEKIPVRFKSVDVGDVYFRSVYASIHPDPAIMDVEEHIRHKLGKDTSPPCYPHMSAFYIDDSEADERKRIVAQWKEAGIVQLMEEGVSLRCPSVDEPGAYEVVRGFEGCEIWIVECEGKVEDWKVLEKVSLWK